MKKTSKKEIKEMVDKALAGVVHNLKITKPSRKTRKTIAKVSKALLADLKNKMKKQLKNATMPRKAKQVAVSA
jgi:hypothetical protein